MTASISMRELQKISADKIRALTHPVPITCGAETVALLVPHAAGRTERLRRLAERSAELAAQRSPEERARIAERLGFDPE